MKKINLNLHLKTENDLEDAVNHINTVIQNSASLPIFHFNQKANS